MYDITAIYMGSEMFRSSVSDKITVNAYKPESRELSISGAVIWFTAAVLVLIR